MTDEPIPPGVRREARRAKLPLLLRLLNRVGPAVASIGLGRVSLSPAALKRAAQSETGLSDFGDTHFEAAFEKLVESTERESSLSHIGRTVQSRHLEQCLVNRLLIQQALGDVSEIGRREILRPMFVAGFSRTGTTLLFNLLALDPSTRSPAMWELLAPAPPADSLSVEEVDRRMKSSAEATGQVWRMAPSLGPMHAAPDPTTKEECFPLLENSFYSPSFSLYARRPSYIEWLFTRPVSDILPAYRYYAAQMRLLMQGHDGKRWLSKSPFHSYLLPALVGVFPDARVVCTHRAPEECVPSWCSFTEAWHSVLSDDVDARQIGEFTTYLYQMAERRIVEAKRVHGGHDIIDIDYRELVRDPIGTVAQIHDHFELALTVEHESAMRTWLAETNPYDARRAGRHAYAAREFGLDEDRLRRLTRP